MKHQRILWIVYWFLVIKGSSCLFFCCRNCKPKIENIVLKEPRTNFFNHTNQMTIIHDDSLKLTDYQKTYAQNVFPVVFYHIKNCRVRVSIKYITKLIVMYLAPPIATEINTGVHPWNLQLSFDHQWLAVDDVRILHKGEVTLWRTDNGQKHHILTGHTKQVNDLLFTSDSQYILSASSDKTVIIWSVSTGKLLHTFRGHSHFVEVISLTADDQWLISGSWDYTVRIWSVQTGTCKVKIPIYILWHMPLPVVCNHDQQIIVMAPKHKIQIWTVRTGKVKRSVNLKRDGKLLCANENQFLFTDRSDYSVEVWDFTTETCGQIFRGHQCGVTYGIFSQEKTKVVSCDFKNTMYIWRVHDGTCIHQFPNYQLEPNRYSLKEHSKTYWYRLEKANIECIIVYTSHKEVHILAINSGQILHSLLQSDGHSFQVSWDGRFFVWNSDWDNGVFKCVEFTDLKTYAHNQNSNDF